MLQIIFFTLLCFIATLAAVEEYESIEQDNKFNKYVWSIIRNTIWVFVGFLVFALFA